MLAERRQHRGPPPGGYACGVPRPGRDPLAATDRLVVDATNLLYALQRGPTSLPPAALIGRLRAVTPAATSVELVFDGVPEPGMRRTRVAAGVRVRYTAPATADAVIVALVGQLDLESREGVLVVTDDGELRAAAARLGARTARSRWLIGRLERGILAAPSAGNRRPPGLMPRGPSGWARDGSASPSGAVDGEGPRWRPGRGATVKRGNPRRGHRLGG